MKDLIAKVEAACLILLMVANEFSFNVMGGIGNHASCFCLNHYKVLKAAIENFNAKAKLQAAYICIA